MLLVVLSCGTRRGEVWVTDGSWPCVESGARPYSRASRIGRRVLSEQVLVRLVIAATCEKANQARSSSLIRKGSRRNLGPEKSARGVLASHAWHCHRAALVPHVAIAVTPSHEFMHRDGQIQSRRLQIGVVVGQHA